jgi:hypothetical protein
MSHSEAGKGDKRRKGDNIAFEDNYTLAFGNKKPVRGSFIWDDKLGKMVDKEEYYANHEKNEAHMIMPDIAPYKSMVTGEMITSRSVHKQHLKRHGLVEVGNETKYLENKPKQMDSRALKETIAQQVYSKLRY